MTQSHVDGLGLGAKPVTLHDDLEQSVIDHRVGLTVTLHRRCETIASWEPGGLARQALATGCSPGVVHSRYLLIGCHSVERIVSPATFWERTTLVNVVAHVKHRTHPRGWVLLNPKESIMYHSEISIAALHQARGERLLSKRGGPTRKNRGQRLRSLLTRDHQPLVPAPAAQPTHSG